MQASQNTTLRALMVVALTALIIGCATEGGRKLDKVGRHEMAAYAGCSPDEVALCVDTNCEPDEFQCIERGDAEHILGVPEFPRY